MERTRVVGPGKVADTSGRKPLDAIFVPRSIAVIGASEAAGSVGRTVISNLLNQPCGARVYPVNPKQETLLGVRCYKSVLDLPEVVDLAVVATPAATVTKVMSQCADKGVKGAIIISAGFKELGPSGVELERQVLEQVRRGGMRVIGPNCLGVMNPRTGMNATFASAMARPGKVAFISQSGALCTSILDWSLSELVGFSAFVSTGSMLDVGWGELIDYLGNDPGTESILIYMESIGDARAFLSAARQVALKKPIIVIKAGRCQAAAKAAASHTGALTGSDEVLDAALRRVGVLRVNSIAELFYMAEVLSRQPHPKGPRLTMVTNAGGPGVLATDALIDHGGELATLSAETVAELDTHLPPQWSHANPIDVLGDAGPARYAEAVGIAAKDPESDGILVVLTPQDMTDPTRTAQMLQPYAKSTGKPLLASWMGGASVETGIRLLNSAGIPTYPFPDTAARVFQYMWRYSYNLQGIYETPAWPTVAGKVDVKKAVDIISGAQAAGRVLLDEVESKQLLAAYDIPTVPTGVAATAEAAVGLADSMGYPVVLKLYSRTITHKTDVGGVKLNLATAEEVRAAFAEIKMSVSKHAGEQHFQGATVQPMIKLKDSYEVILGSSIDPQFGPVLLFGTGGQLVEVFKDRALGLPPLNATLALRMMEQTKIYTALKGVRGRKGVDMQALAEVLVRFGQLVVENPCIKEIDINPLLVSAGGMAAVDARVVLYGADTPAAQLPVPAIRPYPAQYASPWGLKDGTTVMVRPIRAEDEPAIVQFQATLSERSVQMRYLGASKLSHRTAHKQLIPVCFNDYDRELTLIAERMDEGTGQRAVLGMGTLTKMPGSDDGEFSLLVSDPWQHQGLGTELLKRLLGFARGEGVRRVCGDISSDNHEMQRLCLDMGFAEQGAEGGVMRVEMEVA